MRVQTAHARHAGCQQDTAQWRCEAAPVQECFRGRECLHLSPTDRRRLLSASRTDSIVVDNTDQRYHRLAVHTVVRRRHIVNGHS